MKINKPNITEGERYQSMDLSRLLVNSEGIPVICVSRDNSLKAHERFANAKAISAVPEMIDELISDYEAFEWMYEHTNDTAIAYYCHDKMESIKQTLIKLGCTYEH